MMSPSPPEGDWGTGRGLAPAKSGGRPRDKTPVDAVETRNAVAAPDVASWGGAADKPVDSTFYSANAQLALERLKVEIYP
jgi:hypothetical protein